jgi:hypothetical protein
LSDRSQRLCLQIWHGVPRQWLGQQVWCIVYICTEVSFLRSNSILMLYVNRLATRVPAVQILITANVSLTIYGVSNQVCRVYNSLYLPTNMTVALFTLEPNNFILLTYQTCGTGIQVSNTISSYCALLTFLKNQIAASSAGCSQKMYVRLTIDASFLY